MRILSGHRSKVLCVGFAPGGMLASGSVDGLVKLWRPLAGREAATLSGHDHAVTALAFSPDGLLATAGADGTVRLWDVRRRAQAARLHQQPGDRLTALAFSPDGRTLAAGAEESYFVLWDVAARRCLRQQSLHGQPASGVAFSPDGAMLAVVAQRGGLLLRDLATGKQQLIDSSRTVRAIVFLPDSATVAIAWAATVRLVDVADPGAHLRAEPAPDSPGAARCLEGHEDQVLALAAAPDGRTLLSGGRDGVVCVWNVATGQLCDRFDWQLGAIHGVAVAPDGMTAAACGARRGVVVWDLG